MRLADQEVQNHPVTLLAAVRDGESVVVAADSSVWHVDRNMGASWEGTTVKFRPLRNTRALYGFHGEQTIGEPMGIQIEKSTAWARWPELVAVVGDRLREVNTVPCLPREQVTSVLVAGYLEGELGIYRIEPYGRPEVDESPAFLGDGRVVAKTGWHIAEQAQPDMAVEARLRLVMRHTVRQVGFLGFPVHFWRVTPGEIEELAGLSGLADPDL